MYEQKVRGGGECQLKQTMVVDRVVMAKLVSGAEIQEHRVWEIQEHRVWETGDALLRGRVVNLSQVGEG